MANNLVDGEVDLQNCAFITEKQAETLDKRFAKKGDVLLTHKGTIGRTAILDYEGEYVVLTPQVTYYRALSKVKKEFIKAYFDTDYFQASIKRMAKLRKKLKRRMKNRFHRKCSKLYKNYG